MAGALDEGELLDRCLDIVEERAGTGGGVHQVACALDDEERNVEPAAVRPVIEACSARHDCLRALSAEWPGTEPLLTEEADRLPGLTALARLTAMVCRLPPEVWLETEEQDQTEPAYASAEPGKR
ncbi:hypothetical protein ACFY2G_38165 [Streptomyces collinus]|uniref:hypothetical protein n=1 Tax=Streptomyces collinus TaxID=42684 RepID=UPI0036AAD6E1